jgi:hypothetical protein
MIEPRTITARPPGMLNGSFTLAVQASRMIAKPKSAIHDACHISNAALIEMNAIEMPARVPSMAARGVYRRIVGPTKAPIRMITPIRNAHAMPASQASRAFCVLRTTGSMITKVTKK